MGQNVGDDGDGQTVTSLLINVAAGRSTLGADEFKSTIATIWRRLMENAIRLRDIVAEGGNTHASAFATAATEFLAFGELVRTGDEIARRLVDQLTADEPPRSSGV